MDELGSIRLNQVTVSVEITTGMQMTLMNQIILLILRDVDTLLLRGKSSKTMERATRQIGMRWTLVFF